MKTVLCIQQDSQRSTVSRLVRSGDLFASRELVQLETVTGSHVIDSIVSLGVVHGFIVVAGVSSGYLLYCMLSNVASLVLV